MGKSQPILYSQNFVHESPIRECSNASQLLRSFREKVAPVSWIEITPKPKQPHERPHKPIETQKALPRRPRGRPPKYVIAEFLVQARRDITFTNSWRIPFAKAGRAKCYNKKNISKWSNRNRQSLH